MSLVKDVLGELLGMFIGDARLSGAVLAVVSIAVALITLLDVPPLLVGGVLLLGSVAVLVGAVLHAARGRDATRP